MNKYILTVVCFFYTLTCQAEITLPNTCSASQPKLLLKNTVKTSEIKDLQRSKDWGQSSKANKFWTAYSDRENNTTYNGPSSSSGVFGKLDFNESVRIAQIEGDYALVYQEKQKGLDYPHISTSAVAKGWIHMNNLLLWGTCPTNEVGIYQKALIVMNLDEVKSGSSEDLGKRYMNPDERSGARKLVSSMNFYFVMKEAGNGLVLLARECKMEGYTSQVLYGWVNKNSFVEWNQRTCVEPNWKPNVAEQMSGQAVPVYKNTQLSQKGCEFPLGRVNRVTETRSTKYRMGPQEMRYPLLDNDSNNDDLYKVTAFARPDGSAHVSIVPESDEEIGSSITNNKMKEMSNINLIVVIDGTSSMEKFYPPTQKIIQQAYDYFGKANKNVKVGIVIYRDYADGEYITEYLSMRSPTDPKIAEFLTHGGKYGIKSAPADHTYAEALYKGLELALDNKKMGYSPENSNLMLVIGDCGNDLEDTNCLTDEEIINLCIKNRMQVSAFQVRNNNEQSFLLFRQQMGKIVRENLKRQYSELGSGFKMGFKELADGYEFRTNLPKHQNFFIGSTRNAELDQVMDVTKLYDIVKNSYMQYSDAIDAGIAIAGKGGQIIEDSESSADGTNANIDLAYLQTIFSSEQIETLKKSNSLMAFEGYTKKKTNTDLDYWQPIIYISSDEFAGLMEKLQPVMNAANSGSTDRKPYVEAIKALIRSMVPDITEQEMDEKDVKEVMALISGLNEASNSLKGRTLIQIQDEKIVSLAEFDGMIAEFRNKYNKLKKIREQKYPFSIERNKTTWYWIPVEDLP